MIKMLSVAVALLCFTVGPVLAHHPAEDMVDSEIYAMIDALVADTPHADLIFDDQMGLTTTIISIDNVGTTDVLIMDGLLDLASMLEGDVELLISFPEQDTSAVQSSGDMSGSASSSGSYYEKKWSEWGCPVEIMIIQEY